MNALKRLNFQPAQGHSSGVTQSVTGEQVSDMTADVVMVESVDIDSLRIANEQQMETEEEGVAQTNDNTITSSATTGQGHLAVPTESQ